MKPTTTTILLSCAAFLLVFVLVFERHIESSREAEGSSRLLVPISGESLKRIRITSQMGDLSIDRKDYGWKLMKPVDDHADPNLISSLADKLARLTIRETIDRDEIGGKKIKLSRLGLSESELIEVKLEFDGDRESLVLHFGAQGPLQGTIYVRMPDSEKRRDVYVVDGDFRNWIADPKTVLRDRRLFRVDPGEIESYVVETENGVMSLKREPNAPRWYVERPLKARANDDIAYSILDELSKLEIDEFLDPRAAATAGLATSTGPDMAIFRLEEQSGDQITVRLRERENDNGEVSMLATVSGRDAVFRIDNNLVSRLPKNINQMRYPKLADINLATVARVQIETPLDSVDLRRLRDSGNSWSLVVGGQIQRANQEKVDQLLAALNSETIVEFRSDTAARLDEYGLDRPMAQVAITTSTVDGVELDLYSAQVAEAQKAGRDPESIEKPNIEINTRTVRFGRKSGILLNAKFDDEPFVYAIDPAFLSLYLPTHPIAWRGLDLLGFELLSVQAIEISEAGMPDLKLFYNYLHGKWTGVLGKERVDEMIDGRLAERLAAHLGRFSARQWLTGSRQDAYRALSNPSMQLQIKLQKPSIGQDNPNPVGIVSIKFAPATITGDRIANYFGQFEGHPDVFILDGTDYDRIAAPVLRKKE